MSVAASCRALLLGLVLAAGAVLCSASCPAICSNNANCRISTHVTNLVGSPTCAWGCSRYGWSGLGAAWYVGGTDCCGCAPDPEVFNYKAGFRTDTDFYENRCMRAQAAAIRARDCPTTKLALKNKWRLSNAGPTQGNPQVREVHLFSDTACSERVALPRTGVVASGVSESEENSHRVADRAVDGDEGTSWAPQCDACPAKGAWLTFEWSFPTTIRCAVVVGLLGAGGEGSSRWQGGLALETWHEGEWVDVGYSPQTDRAVLTEKCERQVSSSTGSEPAASCQKRLASLGSCAFSVVGAHACAGNYHPSSDQHMGKHIYVNVANEKCVFQFADYGSQGLGESSWDLCQRDVAIGPADCWASDGRIGFVNAGNSSNTSSVMSVGVGTRITALSQEAPILNVQSCSQTCTFSLVDAGQTLRQCVGNYKASAEILHGRPIYVNTMDEYCVFQWTDYADKGLGANVWDLCKRADASGKADCYWSRGRMGVAGAGKIPSVQVSN